MTYKADTPVKVYNHSVSPINLPGQFRAYYLEGTRGVPTVVTMPFSDVEYINSRSPVFRNGTVQFSEAERDDVYRALYLDNWRDTVLFDEEIDRIIRENDMDAAEKFLKLTTVAEIHRVRGHMVALARRSQHQDQPRQNKGTRNAGRRPAYLGNDGADGCTSGTAGGYADCIADCDCARTEEADHSQEGCSGCKDRR